MNIWIPIWLIFWFGVMGAPNHLFKKYGIAYYKYSWQHTIFFILATAILGFVYRSQFAVYFQSLPSYFLLVIALLFLLWIFVPFLYSKDYFTRKERFGYQLPKFFEILFLHLCFLGGLLTFGFSPIAFGLVFFAVHVPILFWLPKKFALMPVMGSLVGGVIFATLQSFGVSGFLVSLLIHLFFWSAFHFLLSSKKGFLGIIPVKR